MRHMLPFHGTIGSLLATSCPLLGRRARSRASADQTHENGFARTTCFERSSSPAPSASAGRPPMGRSALLPPPLTWSARSGSACCTNRPHGCILSRKPRTSACLFYQTNPSNTVSNPFDLHQAWVSMGQPEGPGVFRSESAGRIWSSDPATCWRQPTIGGSTPPETSMSPMALITTKFFKTELVAGSAILVNPEVPDEHKPGDHIYADYNTFPICCRELRWSRILIARTSDNVKSKEGQIGNMDTLAVGGAHRRQAAGPASTTTSNRCTSSAVTPTTVWMPTAC